MKTYGNKPMLLEVDLLIEIKEVITKMMLKVKDLKENAIYMFKQ